MSEPTIHMIARAKHNEMRQAAELGETEGYTIYVQGWLPRQITRLRHLISQQAGHSIPQQGEPRPSPMYTK